MPTRSSSRSSRASPASARAEASWLPEAFDLVLKLAQSGVWAPSRGLGVSQLEAQAFDGHFQRAPL